MNYLINFNSILDSYATIKKISKQKLKLRNKSYIILVYKNEKNLFIDI